MDENTKPIKDVTGSPDGSPEPPHRTPPAFLSMGALIGFGAALGLLVGTMLGNLAFGLAAGAAFGTVIGAVVESGRKR